MAQSRATQFLRQWRVTQMNLRVCAGVTAFLLSAAAVAADTAHEWSYSGDHDPAHWAELSPEFATCGIGQHQSPINVDKTEKAALPPLEIHYQPAPLAVVDTGHSLQVNYAAGSTITVGGHTYALTQFHFHRPSEEQFHGKPFAMVAHLVHTDANGKLAVVAVELREGGSNSVLDAVLKNVPTGKGNVVVARGRKVDVSDLLPRARGYYTYTGSLTTPPCSEEVTWYVLKNPVDVSAQQVAEFSKYYSNNARPVQPLNGRVVRETLD
jgi:carbonic anhydrase